MKALLSGILVGTTAVGVFSGSVVGLLAFSGRLNPAGVRNVPLLNRFLQDDGTDGATTNVREATSQKPRDQGQGESPTRSSDRVKATSLFTLESFAPPTTREEIQDLYARTKKGYAELELEAAAQRKRELELTLRESDLEQRRRGIDALMERVTRAMADLEAERLRFASDVTIIKQAEDGNIKRQAAALAAMDPSKASEFLLALGPDKEPLAVKLLVSMETEGAAAILAAMDTQRGARLIDRATRLIKRD